MLAIKDEKAIFYEPPRRFTLFDVILTLYGAAGVAVSVYWTFSPPDATPYWAFIFIGALHFFFALFPIMGYYDPRYTATIDYRQRKVIYDKTGLFGDSTKEYDFESIRSFHIEQNFDPDTVAGFDVEMELKTGERINVPNSFDRDGKAYEETVRTANNYLSH
jgi:hypothetical protein